MYGIIIALFTVGVIASSLGAAKLAAAGVSLRFLMFISMFLSFTGNLMFALLYWNVWGMMVARFISGLGLGTTNYPCFLLTLCRNSGICVS